MGFSPCCSSALWLSHGLDVFFVVVFVLVRRFLCIVLLVDMGIGQSSNEVDIMCKKYSSYSVINPVIYGFFNENFKREFLLLKHMVKYWMNEYDWKLCQDCKNYPGSLSFLNNLYHALSFSFCQGLSPVSQKSQVTLSCCENQNIKRSLFQSVTRSHIELPFV